MRRLLALMAVVALVVAFALPMAGTAEAGDKTKKMNPCQVKSDAKDMMEKAKNPCGKNPCAKNPCAKNPCAKNPCGVKAKGKDMMDKAKNPCKSK